MSSGNNNFTNKHTFSILIRHFVINKNIHSILLSGSNKRPALLQLGSFPIMNNMILFIVLITSSRLEARYTGQDENLDLNRVFVEVGQIKMLEPTEEDVREEDEEVLIDGVETHLIRKRSPDCLLSCLRQKTLHAAQCHSFCRYHFG